MEDTKENILKPNVPETAPTSEHATSDAQDRIVPLSGNPYFTSVVTKCQVTRPCTLLIPKSFCQFLPYDSAPVVLSCRNRSWEVRCCRNGPWKKRFTSGWKQFAIDNNLKVGDACVYELMDREKLKLRVQILRGEIPAEVPNVGQSSDFPIIID